MVVRVLAYVAVAIACVSLTGCFQSEDEKKIERTKTLVQREMIDPDSAKFDDIKVYGNRVCGYVNGKNRFGGYVGRKMFVVDLVGKDDGIVVSRDAAVVAGVFCKNE